jgi:hypothetical protein
MNIKGVSKSLKVRGRLEDVGQAVRTMLKGIISKLGGECGLNSPGSGWEPVMDPCEHGNELAGSRRWGILDWLTTVGFARRSMLRGVG